MIPGTCRESLRQQQAEAARLDATITKNPKELGLSERKSEKRPLDSRIAILDVVYDVERSQNTLASAGTKKRKRLP